MLITKRINNNVVLAKDDNGNDLVVFGKGLGFETPPYFLDDESGVQSVFQHVTSDVMKSLSSISSEAIGVSMDIARLAAEELKVELNPNLYLMLADHIQFSADRLAEGVVIENPLMADVPYIYPKEWEIGKKGLLIAYAVMGVEFPEAEAAGIALHIANAEKLEETSERNLTRVMRTVEIVEDVARIVEERLQISLDRSSHACRRFITHMRYLVTRLIDGAQEEKRPELPMLMNIAKEFPRAQSCTNIVCNYFMREHGWDLTDEERLYLLMYLVRLSMNADE